MSTVHSSCCTSNHSCHLSTTALDSHCIDAARNAVSTYSNPAMFSQGCLLSLTYASSSAVIPNISSCTTACVASCWCHLVQTAVSHSVSQPIARVGCTAIGVCIQHEKATVVVTMGCDDGLRRGACAKHTAEMHAKDACKAATEQSQPGGTMTSPPRILLFQCCASVWDFAMQ